MGEPSLTWENCLTRLWCVTLKEHYIEGKENILFFLWLFVLALLFLFQLGVVFDLFLGVL